MAIIRIFSAAARCQVLQVCFSELERSGNINIVASFFEKNVFCNFDKGNLTNLKISIKAAPTYATY